MVINLSAQGGHTMSKRSQEKRNRRAKEKAKQLRKQRNASPLSRLVGGAEGKGIECWSMTDPDGRLLSYYVFRGLRGTGGHVLACLLVDFDCLGLKDAFCRFDVS